MFLGDIVIHIQLICRLTLNPMSTICCVSLLVATMKVSVVSFLGHKEDGEASRYLELPTIAEDNPTGLLWDKPTLLSSNGLLDYEEVDDGVLLFRIDTMNAEPDAKSPTLELIKKMRPCDRRAESLVPIVDAGSADRSNPPTPLVSSLPDLVFDYQEESYAEKKTFESTKTAEDDKQLTTWSYGMVVGVGSTYIYR